MTITLPKRIRLFITSLLLGLPAFLALSQQAVPVSSGLSGKLLIRDLSLRIDNIDYQYRRDEIRHEGEHYLFFRVQEANPVAELRIYPVQPAQPLSRLELLNSPDFTAIDSLVFVNNEHYRIRIRFHDLRESAFPSLIFSGINEHGESLNQEIKLFPYFVTSLFSDHEVIELFQGEEKTIDIPGENLFNLYTDGEWKTHQHFEYRLMRAGASQIRLSVRNRQTGTQNLVIPLQTIQPFIGREGQLSFTPDPLELIFRVNPSRLRFLNADKDFVFYSIDRRRGEELRFDYHPDFQLYKTYRIEDRQEAGGNLIAEIYTRSFTSDNQVLTEIRTFDLHRAREGYLYIKDGERTLFMTNFNVVHRPEIRSIELLREGQDWTSSLNVNPGEKLEVKIEGEGLLDASIRFDGCIQRQDTLRRSDRALFFELEVPIDVPRNKIMIFKNSEITQHELLVREYQRPAPLDFVLIDYGEGSSPISDERFSRTVFYDKTIHEISISFDSDKIDQKERLYGKQYLQIEIRLLDENNRLLDMQTINNVVICPGESSPRHAFYGRNDCRQQPIRLNEHLLRKTYNIDAFSQIVITVRHAENRYNTPGQSQRVTILAERKMSFDVNVSFPAGLLVKEFRQPGVGNLSGISTSVLAEISFYDPRRVGVKRPYKFGAGFIALNAFNFSESANVKRDIGLVAIAAIEPVRSGSKFSVPIYFGVGYLLIENDMFAIFGPGIRVSF